MRKYGLAILIVVSSACSMRESFVPTAPTAPSAITQPTSVSVVVRALDNSQHEPIAGATVIVDDHIRGVTDPFGELAVSVIADREVTISVRKDGWHALLTWARAKISTDGEVWTYYFEPSVQ